MSLVDKIAIGLQLTVYGTGLVFLVLAFLWGLMVVLLRLDRGAPITQEAPPEPEEAPSPSELSPQERAAVAVAVLLHRTREKAAGHAEGHEKEGGAAPNPWVVVGRTRQLGKR